MAKNNTYRTHIEVQGHTLPVKVSLNDRTRLRFKINRDGISLRERTGSLKEALKSLPELQQWVEDTLEKKPHLLELMIPKEYNSGDILQVGERKYWLDLIESDRQTSTGNLVVDTICLKLNNRLEPLERTKTIKTLLSRVVAMDYYPEICNRVFEINNRTFRQPINSIRLKYNHSNWGSCSVNKNVNLSTRLLFTPKPVQEYVILHELAHFIEMNHSGRFWALVERYMPDYRDKETWLREKGRYCDF